jgi:tetratricopeptide (TPR) repeat protein
MKSNTMLIGVLAMGAMLSGCDAVRHVALGSVSAMAENGVLPQVPRETRDSLRRDPTCPIAGLWIRQEDAYATMVVEIRKNLQGEVSGTLLYVPATALANHFRRMDVKLRQIVPTTECLRQYEALSLCRYHDDASRIAWSEVTIRLLDDDRFVLQEKVWSNRAVGHRQVWTRVQPDTIDMAYVHFGKAWTAVDMDDIRTAASHFAHAAQHRPDDAYFCNDLAWELAVSPHEQIRRPRDAIALAELACQATEHSNPMYLDTLAAAYAADGQFSEAVDTQRKSLQAVDGFVIRTLESMGEQLHPLEALGVQFHVQAQSILEGYDNPEQYLRELVLLHEGINLADFRHRLTLYEQQEPYVQP